MHITNISLFTMDIILYHRWSYQWKNKLIFRTTNANSTWMWNGLEAVLTNIKLKLWVCNLWLHVLSRHRNTIIQKKTHYWIFQPYTTLLILANMAIPAWQVQLRNKNLLVPWVRFTSVLPICRVANIDGAFTSYQSFLVNGSTLKKIHFYFNS